MSSPAVIERSPSTQCILPASRLILGRAASQRKRPQSVRADGRAWTSVTPLRFEELRQILQSVLPSPLDRRDRVAFAAAVMADFVVVGLSYLAVAQFFSVSSSTANPWFTSSGAQVTSSAYGALLLQAALLTLIGHSEGVYSRSHFAKSSDSWKLARAVTWSTLLVWVGTQCGVDEIAVPVLLASAPLNYIGMLGWRRWRDCRSKRPGSHIRNVLIVGAGTTGRAVASCLEHDRARVVRGFVCNDAPQGGDVLGAISNLAAIARAEFVDEVIITIHEREAVRQAILEARRNRLDVKIVPDLLGFKVDADSLEHLGEAAVLRLHEEPIPALELALKRAMDICLSAILLLLCSPLLALIALWIRVDSAGAVFYCASRVGRKGGRFTCYKFRTMVSDAERWKAQLRDRNQREGPCFKIADDPRITRAGRLLRRYSLDELPQLWNVLKGDMSLVGPRPHPPDDYQRYQLELDEWGVESGNYILFLGRFSPEKNCHLLVEAFENLETRTKLVLAGGSSYSDAYAQQLRNHRNGRIKILDWVSGDDLDELLTNAMLFVLPSDLEGLSLALLDAMAAGVCVLTSDVPENRELVDGVGFTFRRGNALHLERMLDFLSRHPVARESAARAARERIRERYQWRQISIQIERVYWELMGWNLAEYRREEVATTEAATEVGAA